MNLNNTTHRKMRIAWLIYACFAVCFVSGWAIADEAQSKSPVALNLEMQTVFKELTTTEDAAAREGLWNQIRQFDRADRSVLIQQLTLFASESTSTRSSMLTGAVIKQFEISDTDVINALLPMMDTDAPKLRKQIKGTLAEFEDQSASRPPDFSTYREIIAAAFREGRDIPPGLVKHMYEVDPGIALLTMMRASQMRTPDDLQEILWAEHVVSESVWKKTHGFVERDSVDQDVTDELQRLAGHGQWWVRLYVPAVMKHDPTFKSENLLDALTQDSNTDVAQAARDAQ